MKSVTGTREWAETTVNCMTGCEHGCRYCYARDQALRFRRIATAEEWNTPVLREHEVAKARRKVAGRIMFPSTHDIITKYVLECRQLLTNLLAAGNDVLIVTKPHWICVKLLCENLSRWKRQILWRFTIGAMDDKILRYWEPGAPSFQERLDSLQWAHEQNYATSVSCEPCLDSANVVKLFRMCEPYITDTFWIGKANKLAKRCVPGTDPAKIARVEAGQTNDKVWAIYKALKDEPKIRWKDSYKKVLGLSVGRPEEKP